MAILIGLWFCGSIFKRDWASGRPHGMVRQGAGVKEQKHGERASKGTSLQMKISPGDLTYSSDYS